MNAAMNFEGVSGSLFVSVIAFSIVFAVLFGLTLMIYAMRLFAGEEKKTNQPEVKPVVAKPSVVAPVAAVAAAPVADNSANMSGRVVAVITAAIMAATGGRGKILAIAPVPEELSSIERNARWTRNWRANGVAGLVFNAIDRGWKR